MVNTSTSLSSVQGDDFVSKGYDLRRMHLESTTGGQIPLTHLGWLPTLPATASDEEIRETLEREGVVHLKGVVPRETVLEVRRRYFEYVQALGVLKEGTAPVDGIFCGGNPLDFAGPGVASQVGKTMDNCPDLKLSVEAGMADFINEFATDHHIMDVVKRIKPHWADPILFKRQLLRSNIPGSEGSATKVHYDQIFLRAAPPTSLTAWVPMGDISPLSGGLLYLEKSVDLGLEIENEFTEMNKGLTEKERLSAFNVNMVERGFLTPNAPGFSTKHSKKWLVGNYEAGDVVFHHPCAIHCSSTNNDPEGRIRLATDLRFADREQKHDERWAKNYFIPGDGL
ncbi:hypothetical protein MNV49_001713 [Pseudohyphozyma bogoriensis]|nr:hypothetical protein MNV49_001713 [Pseudohyphozyma bogoriensis]